MIISFQTHYMSTLTYKGWVLNRRGPVFSRYGRPFWDLHPWFSCSNSNLRKEDPLEWSIGSFYHLVVHCFVIRGRCCTESTSLLYYELVSTKVEARLLALLLHSYNFESHFCLFWDVLFDIMSVVWRPFRLCQFH